MKVKSIEINNLKSISKKTIDFSPNINLLIGANNSGKSCVLKSLLNLQYARIDRNDIRINEGEANTLIKITDISVKEASNFFKIHPQQNANIKDVNVWYNVFKDSRSEILGYFESSGDVAYQRDGIPVIRGRKGMVRINLHALEKFPDSEERNNFIYPFLAKRKSDYYINNINAQQTYSVSPELKNLSAKIQKVTNSSHPKSKEFNRLCLDILGFEIGVIPIGQNNGSGIEPGIYVNDSTTIPLSYMGEGVSNIVGFIVTLLTEDKKLYLVEELENDIHPKALKKLLELLISKSQKNQFVISTHSHIVLKYLGSVPESKIFYFDWNPTIETEEGSLNIPTTTITEVENNPENRIDILEKLGYDFEDFELYDAYLLLEESSAESIMKVLLIPDFVPELHRKLKTIAAKGVDDLKVRAIDFHRLFTFIHTNPIYYKKAWIAADGDEAGLNCIKEIQSTFRTWPVNHFTNFSKANFEEYYPKQFQKQAEEALKQAKAGKMKAKKALLDEVIHWIITNRKEAKKEFAVSAKEIIDFLKGIAESLKK